MPLRYAELTPDELDKHWSKRPLAIIPWGALEWHGPHLPLGLDGIVAEAFAERVADKTQGVLLPGCWMPITTLPHPSSLQISTEAFRLILDDLLEGLYGAGARVVCIVSGHYAQGHEIELYEAALRAMDSHNNLQVLAATPLEVLGDDSLLDHAGRWETAQLQSLKPELVHLEALPTELKARSCAVLGEDPRKASAEEGSQVLDKALARWTAWVDDLLAAPDTTFLREFYAQRKRDYAPYVRTYYMKSWEQALRDWWLTMDR
ncbi:MAG: creatinine amidohydrolase [Fimbriimonadaceae bacterium]|jgi:creatinine amidohydrolase|nr:creatinine amidohydrolase [Fimbriimonadaceae bacterium]